MVNVEAELPGGFLVSYSLSNKQLGAINKSSNILRLPLLIAEMKGFIISKTAAAIKTGL